MIADEYIEKTIEIDQILLILTTAVSLEAIYLALFIQMTVNRNTQDIVEVASDIDQIQEDVEELGGEFDDIQEDVEEITNDIDKLHEPSTPTTLTQTDIAGITQELQKISLNLASLSKEVERLKTTDK